MVPTTQSEIPPAIEAALDRLLRQVRADATTCGPAHEAGAALLGALGDCADEVRRRLHAAPSTATMPTSENVRRAVKPENEAEGADTDE